MACSGVCRGVAGAHGLFIDAAVPDDLAVHLILDNYRTHKHAKVQTWLTKHPPVPPALHPHVEFMAEPGRAVVP